MTPVTTFAGRKVALFGLGGSGLATVQALKAGGCDVIAWDDSPESAARARDQDITVADLREADWSGFSALILSPGVPLTHPEPHWTVPLAKAASVEIIGDIELFCRERAALAPDAPFVAITGTNGKSTTTALIAHLLREAGRDVQMGGNIGTPILALEPPSRERVHVIEMSSFQIELTPSLKPSVGVLLNITPDHLDRHGTMKNYVRIKYRAVNRSTLREVISVDDEWSQEAARWAQIEGSRSTRISTYPILSQDILTRSMVDNEVVYANGSRIIAASIDGDALNTQLASQRSARDVTEDWRKFNEIVEALLVRTEIADLNGIASLRGQHNAQNAAAASATALVLGIAPTVIASILRSFPGLPHRMEQIAQRGRVLFVNDSKATNADSTEKALTAFHDVHWIVGGKAKEGGIAPLSGLFERVAHAYLIGESSDAFAKSLDDRVPYTLCGTLDVATAKAAAAAATSDAPEPVVLLSPACASYDQFRNFEERGNRFRALVQALD